MKASAGVFGNDVECQLLHFEGRGSAAPPALGGGMATAAVTQKWGNAIIGDQANVFHQIAV